MLSPCSLLKTDGAFTVKGFKVAVLNVLRGLCLLRSYGSHGGGNGQMSPIFWFRIIVTKHELIFP